MLLGVIELMRLVVVLLSVLIKRLVNMLVLFFFDVYCLVVEVVRIVMLLVSFDMLGVFELCVVILLW